MKIFITFTCTLSLLVLTPTTTQADDRLLRLAISLCDFAKTDDRTSMRRKLRAAGMRLRAIYPAIKCGDDGSLLRVATINNAMSAAKFLASKAGSDAITAPGHDGKTIVQWAEELVAAGDESKKPFLELFKSEM
ncbi:DUF3718 domain-containing protein [Pleionea sediminis]|uniref:DUF3718 domain-containing protein n=1 Tax=Pleionea sediminis TaxID=2569479 RepID=UPI0011856183|nr:DUF3718 domain-containing protein [Pleionea sediminis]